MEKMTMECLIQLKKLQNEKDYEKDVIKIHHMTEALDNCKDIIIDTLCQN